MNKSNWQLVILLLTGITIASCKEHSCDLAIVDVKIFDSKNKKVINDKTILIRGDSIAAIISANQEFNALNTIEGNKRLVTSGFIDTHIHLTDIYGDYENAPEYIEKDSINSYQDQMAQTYLKYGTTTIVDMAQPEKWIDVTIDWQKEPSPHYPNLFITGSAIISDEKRVPYICHTEVADPIHARKKIQKYDEIGLKHIKLYWRLRELEMKAVIEEAKDRNMNIYGHIDQNVVSIQKAVDLGVNHFEHFLSLPASIINYREHFDTLMKEYKISPPGNTDEYLAMLILYFDYIRNKPELKAKFDQLIENLAKKEATLSTTIHILGSLAEQTYFFTSMARPSKNEKLNLNYSSQQKDQLKKAYFVMMQFLKEAYDKGVKIRIGTDCREGGKAMLSELLLLSEANFKTEDILQIATSNGSESMKIDRFYGSIEVGKKADLIIFDKSPFDNYKNFLAKKTIIKGGQIFSDN